MTSPSDLDVRIRPATAADRARLVPLINAAFSIETFLEGTRTDETRLAAMMETGTILVAEGHDGRLWGSVYTEVRGNDSEAKRGYLGMLAVDPAIQGASLGGSGVARRMVVAAEERFRALGCEAVEITVLSLRAELPRIYRRFGYVETGREEFHPTQPLKPRQECHSIVMVKRLRQA